MSDIDIMDKKVDDDGSKQKDAVKRPIEMEKTGTEADAGEHELDASEPKKIKRTVQQEIALEELSNCDAILKSESLNMTTKMTTLSTFYDSLLNHNVNILLLKDDFNEWVKSATLTILQGSHVPSIELFTYLTSTLRIAPAIFEPMCDQILSVVLFRQKEHGVFDSYNEFMKLLVLTFEKLRRFPKLIAKLLCYVRDYKFKPAAGIQKSCHPGEDSVSSKLILPPGFVDSIGPVISLLPIGQITDLWKTLHHNFAEECIKKFPLRQTDEHVPIFLNVVTQIFIEFLKNVKLADSAVPEAAMEKVSELMLKFRDECLKPLGCRSLQEHGIEFSKPFLQLAYTWAELNALLLHYNLKYKKFAPVPVVDENPSSTNLTYLHPYIEVKQWNKLAKVLEDTPNYLYMINLVAQKLKYITVFEKVDTSLLKLKSREVEEGNQLIEEHIKNAANFLWIEQIKLPEPTIESMEICSLVAEYISPEETIQLGNNFIKKIAMREEDKNGTYYDLINSASNNQIQCGLVLESLVEVLRRLGKMKILEKEIKATLKDILSIENRAVILKAAVCNTKETTIEDTQKEMNISLLRAVNKIMEKANSSVKSANAKTGLNSCSNDDEFSSDLIYEMLKYLSELPMEDYPLHLKTIVFLCSVPIMIGIVRKADKNLVDMVGHIFTKSANASLGNVTLFAVKWTIIFKWFCGHIDFFSESVQKEVINTILRNIYISPKSAAEFEDEFNVICESEMISSKGVIASLLLEFLTTEVQHGAKTKLIHQLQSHTRKLTQFVVKSMQESLDASGQSNTYLVEATSYRSCSQVQISFKALSKCEIKNSDEDLSQFKLLVSKKVLKALSFLVGDSKFESEADTCGIKLHAIKFLHGICKAKEEFKENVPDDFVLQLWNASIRLELCEIGDLNSPAEEKPNIPKHLFKDIYEAANKEEFEEMYSFIVDMARQFDDQKISDTKIKVLVKMLDELVDAELISEKKQTRWKILDECLHAFLVISASWEATEDCLMNIVLPFLTFQVKLLRRRRPMGNLTSLATCLASTAAVPINGIKNVELYSKVFSSVADLLNAFALHRMDVISFRTHIFLQCFQVLVESLFSRADQKNNLSDLEIFDVRHCAHSIERLCQSVKSAKKEFARVSPYFVAILIKQFEQITVYPVVKNPLLSGCYKLLDLCDEHGVAQLNSMLTTGSREVFKPVYEMYKRFYRYKGRV